ncbi:MAG: VOC family protein [Chitinophagales bacterium]|nr:VOC family protein [Chitinophagales bacterium]
MINTFLMFDGNAEEAMKFYVSVFPNSKIVRLIHYKENEAGAEGSVMHAVLSLNGQEFIFIDSPVKSNFSFNPSMSLHVSCATEVEIKELFHKLSQGGQILMPLDSYGFSKKYCWFQDKYGVCWQLNYISS